MIRSLPEFPEFRSFTIADTSWYYDYYLSKKLNPYVDINPENLFIWLNINNDLMISNLRGTLILKYTNVLNDNKINMVPISDNLDGSIIQSIMTYLKDKGLAQELCEIPASICNNIDDHSWLIEDDCDSYEYILETEQQSTLPGKKFSRQRRRIGFFEREHLGKNIEIKYYDEIDSELRKAFIHHVETMPLNSNDESAKRNCTEPIAIKRNLEYASIFNKKALTIAIDGKIVSLVMISNLDNKTVAINHLKVDYSVQYIFQYTIHQLAKILYKKGILEMNIEQDLGIEGMRTFKERLNPSRLLEKRIIKPRN